MYSTAPFFKMSHVSFLQHFAFFSKKILNKSPQTKTFSWRYNEPKVCWQQQPLYMNILLPLASQIQHHSAKDSRDAVLDI